MPQRDLIKPANRSADDAEGWLETVRQKADADFDVTVRHPSERANFIDALARSALLAAVIIISVFALVIAGLVSMHQQNATALVAVWSVVWTVFCIVGAYYFAPRRHE